MEIIQKNRKEDIVYTTTINEVSARCTIVLQNGEKKAARAVCGGVTVRKPEETLIVNISYTREELPASADLEALVDSVSSFLEECLAKHA